MPNANVEKMFRNHKINFHQSLLLTHLLDTMTQDWSHVLSLCKSHLSQNYLNQVLVMLFSTRASRGRKTLEIEKVCNQQFPAKRKNTPGIPSMSKFRISLRYWTEICISPKASEFMTRERSQSPALMIREMQIAMTEMLTQML